MTDLLDLLPSIGVAFHARNAAIWLAASLLVFLVLRRSGVLAALSEEPARDVVGPCDEFERERAALGEVSEIR